MSGGFLDGEPLADRVLDIVRRRTGGCDGGASGHRRQQVAPPVQRRSRRSGGGRDGGGEPLRRFAGATRQRLDRLLQREQRVRVEAGTPHPALEVGQAGHRAPRSGRGHPATPVLSNRSSVASAHSAPRGLGLATALQPPPQTGASPRGAPPEIQANDSPGTMARTKRRTRHPPVGARPATTALVGAWRRGRVPPGSVWSRHPPRRLATVRRKPGSHEAAESVGGSEVVESRAPTAAGTVQSWTKMEQVTAAPDRRAGARSRTARLTNANATSWGTGP